MNYKIENKITGCCLMYSIGGTIIVQKICKIKSIPVPILKPLFFLGLIRLTFEWSKYYNNNKINTNDIYIPTFHKLWFKNLIN